MLPFFRNNLSAKMKDRSHKVGYGFGEQDVNKRTP